MPRKNESVLEAREAVLIDADEAQRGREHVPFGREAHTGLFGDDRDAVDVQRAHAAGDIVRDLAREPTELRFLAERGR